MIDLIVSLAIDSLNSSRAATTRSTSTDEISSYSPSCMSLTSSVSNTGLVGCLERCIGTEFIGGTRRRDESELTAAAEFAERRRHKRHVTQSFSCLPHLPFPAPFLVGVFFFGALADPTFFALALALFGFFFPAAPEKIWSQPEENFSLDPV